MTDIREFTYGYGAPCAFLRPGVHPDEMLFIMAWGLTTIANRILKDVINHTRNIQGKDFERLPYPTWVDAVSKALVVRKMGVLVERAMAGERFDERSSEIREFDEMFQGANDAAI